jgi:hypothetical protein
VNKLITGIFAQMDQVLLEITIFTTMIIRWMKYSALAPHSLMGSVYLF